MTELPRRLHTASSQTRINFRRHQGKISNKPASQEDIRTKFPRLCLSRLPQTTFIHSKRQTRPAGHQRKIVACPPVPATRPTFTHWKLPNPHARKISTQNFRMSACHATPNDFYTQQAAKPASQENINT